MQYAGENSPDFHSFPFSAPIHRRSARRLVHFLSHLSSKIDQISGASGVGAGWSTEEIALLEIILGKAVYSSDQTNNIESLITLLKSSSSGSGSSGGDGGTSYTITLNLDGVTPSNLAQSISSGSVYLNQLSVADGYALGTPAITMGGYDVTAQYYDLEGNITIPDVQGDIVITCKALTVESLIMVGVGSGYPDRQTFEYTETGSFTQYVVAKESSITGGVLSVDWDTEAINGGPSVYFYLFKDGEPYRLGISQVQDEKIESEGGLPTAYWHIPSGSGSMIQSTAPFKVKVLEGCTCMVCLLKSTLSNDDVINNGTGAVWMRDNISVTVTEAD